MNTYICSLVSDINLGKLLVIIISDSPSVPFSPPSPSDIPIMYILHLL